MKAEKDIGKQLAALVNLLAEGNIEFALCGGLAGGLYRPELRITTDIDVIVAKAELDHLNSILADLGLNSVEIREAELVGGPLFKIKNKSSPIQILAGRDPKDKDVIGIDFLLPTMPWVRLAVNRAQANIVTFGSVPVPTMTAEDLIIAKLFAMKIKPARFKDLDDLEQIFKAKLKMDFVYLCSQLENLELKIPEILKENIPDELQLFQIVRRKKNRMKSSNSSK